MVALPKVLHTYREDKHGPLMHRTLLELRQIARAMNQRYGIRGYSVLSKAALVDRLQTLEKMLRPAVRTSETKAAPAQARGPVPTPTLPEFRQRVNELAHLRAEWMRKKWGKVYDEAHAKAGWITPESMRGRSPAQIREMQKLKIDPSKLKDFFIDLAAAENQTFSKLNMNNTKGLGLKIPARVVKEMVGYIDEKGSKAFLEYYKNHYEKMNDFLEMNRSQYNDEGISAHDRRRENAQHPIYRDVA